MVFASVYIFGDLWFINGLYMSHTLQTWIKPTMLLFGFTGGGPFGDEGLVRAIPVETGKEIKTSSPRSSDGDLATGKHHHQKQGTCGEVSILQALPRLAVHGGTYKLRIAHTRHPPLGHSQDP